MGSGCAPATSSYMLLAGGGVILGALGLCAGGGLARLTGPAGVVPVGDAKWKRGMSDEGVGECAMVACGCAMAQCVLKGRAAQCSALQAMLGASAHNVGRQVVTCSRFKVQHSGTSSALPLLLNSACAQTPVHLAQHPPAHSGVLELSHGRGALETQNAASCELFARTRSICVSRQVKYIKVRRRQRPTLARHPAHMHSLQGTWRTASQRSHHCI